MKKVMFVILIILFLVTPLISASVIEIQTAPLKDVWISARDSNDVTIKVPEKYSTDMCGKATIDYEIEELSFYLYFYIKDGDSTFFKKQSEDKYYNDEIINITVLPEDYNLSLPNECSSDFVYEYKEIALNENETTEENSSNEIETEIPDELFESDLEKKNSFITGLSLSKSNLFTTNNLIYLFVLILIIVIIYLVAKNRNQSHVLHEYEVHNKFPVHKNNKKIENLKKKIEKYEKEIIKLRQQDLNPKTKEKFKKKKVKSRDILGDERDDRVHVSDLESDDD